MLQFEHRHTSVDAVTPGGTTMLLRRLTATTTAAAASTLVGRRWQLRWGADDDEVSALLTGDDLDARLDLIPQVNGQPTGWVG